MTARRAILLAAMTAVICVNVAVPATAQIYPSRPIKIVVPSPAGGSSDVLARLLAKEISRAKGPTIVIENRPGAGTIIATEAVARAAPDGATILNTQTPFIINALLGKVTYDPRTSFEPICHLVSEHDVIVVNSASPYRTLGDLINAARAKPGALTGASLPTSLGQFVFETLKRAANVDMTFVPYPGGAPAINALLGGHVSFAVQPYAGVSEYLKAANCALSRSHRRGGSRRSRTYPQQASWVMMCSTLNHSTVSLPRRRRRRT